MILTKPVPAKKSADIAEIRRALDLLAGLGGVVEIRALKIPGRGKPSIAAGYFQDLDKAAQAAAALDNRKPAGVYFVLNEVNPALLARSPNQITDHLEPTTGDSDITRRRWLPLDFDPARPAGVSASEDEHCAAEDAARNCAAWLSSRGWPAPILADSGNGAHLLYRIDLPTDDASRNLVRNAIEALAQRFTGHGVDVDRGVFNAARIWKLYGTTARKGHDMPDRPHRVARLVDVPEPVQVVPVAKLEALAAMAAKPEPAKTSPSGNGRGEPFTSKLDVARWLTGRGQGFNIKDRPDSQGRTVFILDVCPFDSGHGGGGEVAIMQEPSGKLSAKCMHNSCAGRGWQEFKAAIGPPDGNSQAGHGDYSPEAPADGEARKIDYHPMTCADLVTAKFDIRFIVEGIVAAGQPLVIAGPQKALKTSIALDMAFSLATAGYFLGRFKVPDPVTVGFFSGESGLPTLAETLRRKARAAGHDPAGVRNLIISDRVPQIGSPDHLAAIDAMILEHALDVLFVDPVFMAMDGADAGNLFIQGQLLRRVSEVCQERGCTLALLHHVKKGSGNDYQPLELSSIAWAGFCEAARQWVLLRGRESFDRLTIPLT